MLKNTDAWYELGVANENLNKIYNARNTYQRSMLFDANNTDALFRLGVIAQSAGDKDGVRSINLAIANVDKELAREFNILTGCGSKC